MSGPPDRRAEPSTGPRTVPRTSQVADQRGPLFLQRQRYRQRRVSDAARLLPVAGAVLIYVPLLWPRGEDATAISTVSAGAYLFLVWIVTILAAASLARPLRRIQKDALPRTDGPDADV